MKFSHSSLNHDNPQPTLFEKSSGYKNLAYPIDSNNFNFIDLFAGIGGFRIGMEHAGFECVFSSEWDKDAQKTYETNFNEKPYGDINKVKINDIPNFDVLTGGFPCQPFSNIGLRQGFEHKTQGNLFFNIAQILNKKKPLSFILENVGGLLTHKSNDVKTMDIILNNLEKIGYEVNYKILDAANYSVPQIRKRIFLVGFLKKHFSGLTNFKFPKPKTSKKFINEFIEEHEDGYCISKHLQKKYIYKKDDGHPQVIDKKSRIQVKTLVSTYHKIQRITGTFVKDGKTGLRLLSENECKAIMGFPKNFKIPVSRTQMYRQMGNSVAVPVVKAVAKEVIKTMNQANIVYGKTKVKKSA